MRHYKIKINFIRDILGSQPASDEVKKEYIAKKMMAGSTGMHAEYVLRKLDEELDQLESDSKFQEMVESINDKAITVFYRDRGSRICISDIQLRGFLKDSFAFTGKENKYFKKKSGEAFSQDAYYRKWIGERISFKEQYFPFEIQPEKMEIYQRPLRCETMQGPRVSLAASEMIRAPNSIVFELLASNSVDDEMIYNCLDRGMFKGIGQFGNAQFGTFSYEIL